VFDEVASGRKIRTVSSGRKSCQVRTREDSSHCQLQNHRNKTVVGDCPRKHSDVAATEQRDAVAKLKV
jgi:hypothetical protein